ncbi:LacI family DNA-binding transcriptional regulator [Paenibacillus sp. F411]|uniref:LacI family DNA-binding transcriptional regulator n=1 Tax=Paenibacillus sp. F411 TaxID=2820239 RepID=UPI001AAE258D|nr:LacI family DNA-binding transcriptional regulator [Paenibacillus sp. F411]MBO2944393.1 LacI family DNA-binding transcriptional regulator [Paenibacillus sp. F411]
MSKKITLQHIAEQVGVSKFAVSMALSGKPGISAETREKIRQAAASLGYYSQNHVRMKPRTQLADTHQEQQPSSTVPTVIVLIPNVRFQTKDSLYWGRVMNGVTDALEAEGVHPVVITEFNDELFTHIIQVDKVMGLIGIGMISNALLMQVKGAGIPYVLVDHEDELLPSDSVFTNNLDDFRKAAQHLLGSGHRDIKYIGSLTHSRSFMDRWLGFRMAMEAAGEKEVLERCTIQLEGVTGLPNQVRQQLRRLHEADSLPTAFLCVNDVIALYTWEALEELGIQVPQQCSVFGFDHVEQTGGRSLSTINVSKEELGATAVELLLHRLKNPEKPIQKVLLSGHMLLGSSTAPLQLT